MANTGHKKYERWQQSGTNDKVKKIKASADKFMDYLLSTMDHEVSQHCRIYQLEDVRIWAGESPDELVECLHVLADHCNFPTNDKKEHNVQYHFVRTLSDKDLVKKLLALDLKATTAKMLEVCQTHITISNNLDALGLVGSKPIHAIHQGKHNKQCQHGAKQHGNQHQFGICTKSYLPGQLSCPVKDSTCNRCGKVGHWKPRCHGGVPKGQQQPNKGAKKGKSRGPKKIDDIGTYQDYHLNEVDIVSVLQYQPQQQE